MKTFHSQLQNFAIWKQSYQSKPIGIIEGKQRETGKDDKENSAEYIIPRVVFQIGRFDETVEIAFFNEFNKRCLCEVCLTTVLIYSVHTPGI